MQILRNATVATLAGSAGPRSPEQSQDIGLQRNHTIIADNGRIVWLGPDDEFDGRGGETIDVHGALVTPGYVDAHTHLVYAGDRAFELPLKLAGKSYLEILEAGGGIAHTTRKTRDADVPTLVAEAMPRLTRMRAAGTTTLEAKSGYALQTEGELRMLEANRALAAESGLDIVATFCGAHAVPDEFKGRTDAFVDLVIDEMLPRVAAQGIAEFCDVFVEENVFTYEHGEAIFEAAKRHGLPGRLHADEIVCTEGATLAAKTGCVTADHLLRASDDGIAAMAEAGTMAVFMPTVPLTLMRPEWPRVDRFLAAGVPVALGTDHNPNNPVTDMGLVAQLGCYTLGLSPEQSLTAATWNAAASLRREENVGSIEVGKRADLIVHDVNDVAQLVHEPGRKTAQRVMVAGKWVL